MSDDLLTASAASALLPVTGETLRRWAELGRIRHVRFPSGQIRFYRSDIEALLTPVEPQSVDPSGCVPAPGGSSTPEAAA